MGCVRLVVATHWHDDHSRGLASLLRAATNARFATSAAFQVAEFTRLIATADPVHRRSGIDEFAAIVEILRDRRTSDAPGQLGEPLWAFPSRTLLELSEPGRGFSSNVRALSPSDASF